MDEKRIKHLIMVTVVKQLAQHSEYYIPAASSGRHIHLSRTDVETLFGPGYALKKLRPLSQPGQYACEEKIAIVGPKGQIKGVRVLGPVRSQTQVEISMTDTYRLGIEPAVRMSGDVGGSPGCTLVGPAGQVSLSEGVIVAARHLHMSGEEAALYGLKSGDIVSAKKTGERETVLGNIIVRAGEAHALELHLDIDEANAAGIRNGDLLELVR